MKGENSVSKPEQGKSGHLRAGKAGRGVLEPKWRGVLESMQGEAGVHKIVIQREKEELPSEEH